jgi:hypothetical protein
VCIAFALVENRLMSSPRYPGRDLSLEPLGERGSSRRAHLGPAAQVASPLALAGASESLAAYRALIDAVFTAPGAAEWLLGLRRKVEAMLAGTGAAPHGPVARDAIRPTDMAG